VVVDVQRTGLGRAARYSEMSGPSVERHGSRFLARGGAMYVLEGGWQPERLVVIAFESAEAAHAWYDSDDYRAERAVRERNRNWKKVEATGHVRGPSGNFLSIYIN